MVSFSSLRQFPGFSNLLGVGFGEANGSPAESPGSKPPKKKGKLSRLLRGDYGTTAKTHTQPTDGDTASESNSHQSEITVLQQQLAQAREEINRATEEGNKFREERDRAREESTRAKNDIQAIESAYNQLESSSSKHDDAPIVVPTNISTGPLLDDYVPEGKRDDHYFSTNFNEIRIRIREWVVLTFFKPGVNPAEGFRNLSPSARDEIFRRVFKGVPNVSIDLDHIDSKMVRCILQAYIADAVNDFAFKPYVPGIEMGENIPKLEGLMDGCHATDSHSWKTLTLKLLTTNEKYSQALEQKTQEFTIGITNSLCELYYIPTPTSSIVRNPPQFSSRKAARGLATILKFATKVVLEMRSEPFLFETYMCNSGDLCVDAKWPVLDDGGKLSDEEQKNTQARIFFTLFPALIRHGRGDLETACLVKACVVLN